ncbi:MAG: thymidylate synthase [Bacteroidota bacterium]
MLVSHDTLDDLMYDVLGLLLKEPFDQNPTTGKCSEIIGVSLQLKCPRARISRTETKGKVFSAIGELLWYLSKENNLDFINHYIRKYDDYSEDGKTIYGGYGPRIFNMHRQFDQIQNIINLLKVRPSSRRAVIQIFDAKDLNEEHKEIPCTCTLQFMIRNNKLEMCTYMRSNDAYIGLPHDVFCFTMLQEIIARTLNIELGYYYHFVGSLHLYEINKKQAENFLKEGYQSTTKVMSPMPLGNPWEAIEKIMDQERKIRLAIDIETEKLALDKYWMDILYLLKIYSLAKQEIVDINSIQDYKKKMSTKIFNTYIDQKLIKA